MGGTVSTIVPLAPRKAGRLDIADNVDGDAVETIGMAIDAGKGREVVVVSDSSRMKAPPLSLT